VSACCPLCGGEITGRWPAYDLNTNTIALRRGLVRAKPKCIELYSLLVAAYPKSLPAKAAMLGLYGATAVPKSGDKAVGVHVWHLRKLLEPDDITIDVARGGYVLLPPGATPEHRSVQKRRGAT